MFFHSFFFTRLWLLLVSLHSSYCCYYCLYIYFSTFLKSFLSFHFSFPSLHLFSFNFDNLFFLIYCFFSFICFRTFSSFSLFTYPSFQFPPLLSFLSSLSSLVRLLLGQLIHFSHIFWHFFSLPGICTSLNLPKFLSSQTFTINFLLFNIKTLAYFYKCLTHRFYPSFHSRTYVLTMNAIVTYHVLQIYNCFIIIIVMYTMMKNAISITNICFSSYFFFLAIGIIQRWIFNTRHYWL